MASPEARLHGIESIEVGQTICPAALRAPMHGVVRPFCNIAYMDYVRLGAVDQNLCWFQHHLTK